MPAIDDSVGAGGKNEPHEVALVLLMLTLVKRKSGLPYYRGDYGNEPDRTALKLAIEAFQIDLGLISATPGPGRPGEEKRGQVGKGSQTWQALVDRLPAEARDVRTLQGVPMGYLAMPRSKLQQNLSLFRKGSKNLQPSFSDKVVRLFTNFWEKSGIALVLMDDGGWRTFEEQLDMNSDSGPGETIHHYGYAVDIGFDGLECFDKAGNRVTADRGLGNLAPQTKEKFFAARNDVAEGLHGTTKSGDLYHLQNYEDDPLDSVSSFMSLLHTFGPKKMNWSPRYRKPTDYLCDLGLGGEKVFVGTALDIWERGQKYRISRADLARMVNDRTKRDPKFSLEAFLGIKAGPAGKSGALAEGDISDAHLAAVQEMLRGEFVAAEAHWKDWKPVNYPTADRRPENPVKRGKRARQKPPRRQR
jgi:hypothetical protein